MNISKLITTMLSLCHVMTMPTKSLFDSQHALNQCDKISFTKFHDISLTFALYICQNKISSAAFLLLWSSYCRCVENEPQTTNSKEPVVKNKKNTFCYLNDALIYTLNFFLKGHYFVHNVDKKLIEDVMDYITKTKASLNGFFSRASGGKEGEKKDERKDESKEESKDESKEEKKEEENKPIVNEMPVGPHEITEKCFKDGVYVCKTVDHTKEIYNKVIKGQEKGWMKYFSIDDEFLEKVISHNEMLTVEENNRLLEFISSLLSQKSFNQIEALEKSDTDGYALFYPKNNSGKSFGVYFASKIWENLSSWWNTMGNKN